MLVPEVLLMVPRGWKHNLTMVLSGRVLDGGSDWMRLLGPEVVSSSFKRRERDKGGCTPFLSLSLGCPASARTLSLQAKPTVPTPSLVTC